MCLVYDGFKDLYKVFADGEKIDSGTWTGDGVFEPARLVLLMSQDLRLVSVMISEKAAFSFSARSRVRSGASSLPGRLGPGS